ncbi:MAG: hypothetical protein JKY65_14235 [Planctomycetes bacterium]|nr:hypothetical protein [Planctomycetota bacterium]
MRLAPILVVLLLCAAALPADAQPSSKKAPRTLTRSVDTVVLLGAALGKAKGAHISQLRVYALHSGFLRPITFQIDERDQTGTFCWTGGAKDRRRVDFDRGKMDGNDELVVLARDLGDRALPIHIAMVVGAMGFQEVEITDPITKGKAWLYVFTFPPQIVPGRTAEDFTELRIKRHKNGEETYYWFGETFMYNNDRSRQNAVRATFLGMGPSMTRDFRGTPNLLDSTQVRAVVSFMWITLVRQSNDITVDIGGVIDGPLRVIAENQLAVRLALGYWVKAPNSYLILWRNKMSMPTNANCPVNLDESDDSSYTLCVDLHKDNHKGFKFFNSHNKTPVVIDGKTSAAEKRLDMAYPDWNCVYSKNGGMLSKFVVPDFLRKKKRSKLVYIDDANYTRHEDEEGLEFQKGAFGYQGFHMDMRGLKKGVYPGDYVVWYLPPGFKPGQEQAYLDEYRKPLTGKSTKIAR